jgi:hypothetical protein
MAAILERPRAAQSRVAARPDITPPSVRRVRVPELALGLLLVVGFALGAVLWHSSTTARAAVVVVARPVPRGDAIQAGDLRAVRLGGASDLRVVPWSERSTVVGKVAAHDLESGAVLTKGALLDDAVLSMGEGLVALKLEPGGAPDVRFGDVVDVVQVPQTIDKLDPAAAVVTVAQHASVVSVRPVGDSQTDVIVTLRLPIDDARRVGVMGSAVRLVQVGS